jgi:hypothetical protein
LRYKFSEVHRTQILMVQVSAFYTYMHTHPCNCHLYQLATCLDHHCFSLKLFPINIQPHIPLWGDSYSDFYDHRLLLTLIEVKTLEIAYRFWIRLVLNLIFMRVIYVVAYNSCFFVFIAVYHSIVYIYYNLPISLLRASRVFLFYPPVLGYHK